MRHGRAKAARRTLQFFRFSHGISPPYHVILDGTFLMAVITQKVPLKERLSKALQNEKFSLYVTRSSLDELNGLSRKDPTRREAFDAARRWGLDECDKIVEADDIGNEIVEEDLGAPGKDILRIVTHKPMYFVASQDEELLDVLRVQGTVPIVRLARGVLLLENPSKHAHRIAASEERSKWTMKGSVQEQERRLISHVQERNRLESDSTKNHPTIQQRRKKRAKNPNPLSCKRKANDESYKTRKRRRKKKSVSLQGS